MAIRTIAITTTNHRNNNHQYIIHHMDKKISWHLTLILPIMDKEGAEASLNLNTSNMDMDTIKVRMMKMKGMTSKQEDTQHGPR